MNSSSTLNQNKGSERCLICGAPLIRGVETTLCAHCSVDARADVELVHEHFRAGELTRLNPNIVRRAS